MPSRIYSIRPYGRRYAAAQEPSYSGAFEGGSKFGKMLAGGIGQAIQQHKMDAVANQLMAGQAAQNLPPAQSLGRLPADTGTDTDQRQPLTLPDTGGFGPNVGNLVPTGGLAEMKLRQGFEKEQLANQIDRAKLGDYLARAQGTGRYAPKPGSGGMPGSGSRWKAFLGGGQTGGGAAGGQYGGQGKAGKPAPYQPGTSDPNDPGSDDFGKVRADFDQQYGKGAYDKFQANFPSLKPDAQGNYSILDKNENPVITVPGNDAPYWMSRTNAARIGRGQGYIGTLPEGTNPNSGQKPGTQTNPIAPKSNLELRSLPYGTWLIDPDTGKTMQKQPLKPQGTASAGDLTGTDLASAADLSQPDDLLS